MKLTVKQGTILTYEGEAIIVGIHEDEPSEWFKKIDDLLDQRLTDLLKRKTFKGESGDVYILDMPKQAKMVLVGLGKRKECTLDKLRKAAALGGNCARDHGVEVVATRLQLSPVPKTNLIERTQAVVEGVMLARYRYTKYKTEDLDKLHESKELCLLVEGKQQAPDVKLGMNRGATLAYHANFTKDMVNCPPDEMTPLDMAACAKRLAKEARIKCTVYDKRQITKLGLTGLLAVNKGSDIEPRFIVLDYYPRKAKKTAVLVGKGVTFDSGGIQIKPGKGMEEMKYDMAGGAVVMNAVVAVAKLKLPMRVIGIIPATENMPGGAAYKPSDVIKMLNGKTVEVNHTDAEGRMILADGLAYGVKKFRPDYIFDSATLTGAAVVVLGDGGSILVSNDDDLAKVMSDAGEYTSERNWRLPMWEYHQDLIKSKVADISNIGLGPHGYEAGAITAACFLSNFVDDCKWAHIDLAGPAWNAKAEHYMSEGASGYGVRLFVNALERLCD